MRAFSSDATRWVCHHRLSKKQVSTQLVAQSTRTQVNSRPTCDSIDWNTLQVDVYFWWGTNHVCTWDISITPWNFECVLMLEQFRLINSFIIILNIIMDTEYTTVSFSDARVTLTVCVMVNQHLTFSFFLYLMINIFLLSQDISDFIYFLINFTANLWLYQYYDLLFWNTCKFNRSHNKTSIKISIWLCRKGWGFTAIEIISKY